MLKFKKGDRVRVIATNEEGTVLGYLSFPTINVYVSLDTQKKYGKSLSFNEEELELLPNEEPESFCESMCKVQKQAVEMSKKDAISPVYYKAEGIPEAIDVMRGLMTDEQLEGFLWGNIIKYAYRYGRKGDKKETAGKIEWYAYKLGVLNAKELKL